MVVVTEQVRCCRADVVLCRFRVTLFVGFSILSRPQTERVGKAGTIALRRRRACLRRGGRAAVAVGGGAKWGREEHGPASNN